MIEMDFSKIRALLGLDRGEPARYAVRRSPPETGGWVKLDTDAFEDLDRPVDAEAFRFEHEANEGELEPGTYRLWRIENNLLRSVPDELSWSLRIEEPDDPVVLDAEVVDEPREPGSNEGDDGAEWAAVWSLVGVESVEDLAIFGESSPLGRMEP